MSHIGYSLETKLIVELRGWPELEGRMKTFLGQTANLFPR